MNNNLEAEKAEQKRFNQRTFYHKNKDKIRAYKAQWYQENRKEIDKKNRKYRQGKKEEKVRVNSVSLRREKGLFEVIDVLRKNTNCYLWNKSVKFWVEKDWNVFKQLESA